MFHTAVSIERHLYVTAILGFESPGFTVMWPQQSVAVSRLSTIRWMAGLLIAQAGVVIGTVFAMMTFHVNAVK